MAPHFSYVLITAARNEADYIELTLKSVVAQTVRPLKWVIVSDGSTDATDEIVQRYADENPWIELLRMPERRERHFGGKANAFNAGYARVKDLLFQAVGNLDADVSFECDYFDFLLEKLSDNPRLGIVGTPFREGGAVQYDYRFTSIEHVSGQIQLFRRECLEQIGGYVPMEAGGVDLIAVITARMRGWQTRTFVEKAYDHHRVMSSAKRSPLGIAYDAGRTDYMQGCGPVWEVCRSLYQMTRPPLLIGGLLNIAGYLWAMVGKEKRVVSADLVRFRKTEHTRRLSEFFRPKRRQAASQSQTIARDSELSGKTN